MTSNGVKKALIIFSLALLARALFIGVMYSEDDLSYLLEGDSGAYYALAENIYTNGAYASTPELIPDNHRPPLYPLLLVPFVASGAPLFLIAIVQSVLLALAAAFTYVLARHIFPEGVAFVGALIFALEPGGLYMSSLIFSESLFVIFFAPALLLLGLYILKQDPRALLAASVLLAFAALTRAIALPLVVLVPLAALLGSGWRMIPWKYLALSGAVFLLVISPWLWFNVHTFGSLQFSSTSSRNLYQDNAMQFERWLYPDREPIFTWENAALLVGAERVPTVAGANELGAVAQDFILEHPVEYALFHILYMPRLFVHAGYNDVYLRLTGTALSADPPIYDALLSFHIAEAADLVLSRPPLLLLSKAVFILVSLLALLHPLLAWKRERHILPVSLFFVLFLLLYAFLMSPVGQARLRFPIHPILFLLAADSVRLVWQSYRAKSA